MAKWLYMNEAGVLKRYDGANPTNVKIIKNFEVEVRVEWNGNSEILF
ncbi:hypothetical protein [Oceanobacillus senegalensis]|nr:hypothetical protein [Oceanobacillus senegalensis]